MLGVDESINEMKKTQKTESEKRKKNLDCTYPGNSVFQLGLDLDEANPLFGSIDSSLKKRKSDEYYNFFTLFPSICEDT